MFKFEKKLLIFIEKHIFAIALIVVSLAGFLIRISLRRFTSGDMACDLLPWYNQIKEAGGFRGLGTQVGTYNMLYQCLIAVMTYLPIKPLYAYKILSCSFDYLLAMAAAWFVYDILEKKEKWLIFIVYSIIILSPIVFLNSALWGQCDVIYTFFLLVAFIAFCKEQYTKAFVFFGISLAFKLQAVFLMPLFLFVYFVKKSFSVLYFTIIPISMCIFNIPCIIMGRRISDIFTVYLNQTSEYGNMSMNYPSFWLILNDASIEEGYGFYKQAAIIMTICVLGGWILSWIVNRINLNKRNMLYMAFILVYTCVLFLPSMHERYGYVYEIFGIIILFENKRTLPLVILLHGISLMTYGFYLHGSTINISVLAVVNLAVYCCYAFALMKQLMEDKNSIVG